MPSPPDFSAATRRTLAARAGQRCSNPKCTNPRTTFPHSSPERAVDVGEAAHIRAARRNQARYDPDMTDKERADPSNGIWLCRRCAKMIDNDEDTYPVEVLIQWKEWRERETSDRPHIRAKGKATISSGKANGGARTGDLVVADSYVEADELHIGSGDAAGPGSRSGDVTIVGGTYKTTDK